MSEQCQHCGDPCFSCETAAGTCGRLDRIRDLESQLAAAQARADEADEVIGLANARIDTLAEQYGKARQQLHVYSCTLCGADDAPLKIEEDQIANGREPLCTIEGLGPQFGHPLTANVCRECFDALMHAKPLHPIAELRAALTSANERAERAEAREAAVLKNVNEMVYADSGIPFDEVTAWLRGEGPEPMTARERALVKERDAATAKLRRCDVLGGGRRCSEVDCVERHPMTPTSRIAAMRAACDGFESDGATHLPVRISELRALLDVAKAAVAVDEAIGYRDMRMVRRRGGALMQALNRLATAGREKG